MTENSKSVQRIEPIERKQVAAVVRRAVLEALSPWKSAETGAAYLGVSPAWIWQERREGRLPAHRSISGTQVRFKTEDLDKLLRSDITHPPLPEK